MSKLVLLRHGESLWNQENRFTGWVDVDLSAKGREEARQAGQMLKAANLHFDVVFTSVLKRALKTMWIALEELDQLWIPMQKSWRLNERHYGSLQGLDKVEMARQFGEEQVFKWRRSYDVPPPPLDDASPLSAINDPKYRDQDPRILPRAEALKQCLERVLPFWNESIAPRIHAGERVLIVAHGNSLRAIIKHLDGVPDDTIAELNVPTGLPLVYELDDQLKPLRRAYLGDPAEAARRAQAVAQQTKKST
jgi:2,3-bisphosphoglycerate-dependent phosphoglycerate mutase